MKNILLIGSTYFFGKFESFKSKDRDYLRLKDKGNGYEYIRQITTGDTCYFDVVIRPKEELIQYALENKVTAMQVGKFLIPEFNERFRITIDDLKQLKPLVDHLDKKHEYERIIYDAYIANGKFGLTEEQLQAAYEVYTTARENKANNKVNNKVERHGNIQQPIVEERD